MSAERTTIYIPDEMKALYDYAVVCGKKRNKSASETVLDALRLYAAAERANLIVTDGALFALRDGAFDLIYHSVSGNRSVLMLTKEGDMRYASEIERNRDVFTGKRDVSSVRFGNVSCSGTALIRLLDFKDKLISAFENGMICSLSGYNDMLAACEYKTDVEALPDFFVYIDEANAYFRFCPQGFVVEKSVIRLVDGRFVIDVESVYNDFSTVEVHIVEENGTPVGFDIVRTENPSIVEFSYRKDSNSSMKMRFEV